MDEELLEFLDLRLEECDLFALLVGEFTVSSVSSVESVGVLLVVFLAISLEDGLFEVLRLDLAVEAIDFGVE